MFLRRKYFSTQLSFDQRFNLHLNLSLPSLIKSKVWAFVQRRGNVNKILIKVSHTTNASRNKIFKVNKIGKYLERVLIVFFFTGFFKFKNIFVDE